MPLWWDNCFHSLIDLLQLHSKLALTLRTQCLSLWYRSSSSGTRVPLLGGMTLFPTEIPNNNLPKQHCLLWHTSHSWRMCDFWWINSHDSFPHSGILWKKQDQLCWLLSINFDMAIHFTLLSFLWITSHFLIAVGFLIGLRPQATALFCWFRVVDLEGILQSSWDVLGPTYHISHPLTTHQGPHHLKLQIGYL